MNPTKRVLTIRYWLRASVVALFTIAIHSGFSATIWTGPTNTFTQFNPDPSDQLTPTVALSRGGNGPLYNSVFEDGSDFVISPTNTMWAFGTLNNATNGTLNYQTFAAIRNAAHTTNFGNFAGVLLGKSMVVHILDSDIYLYVKFSAWGQHFAGGFAYERSTAPPAPPTPTVSITSPTNGASFVAPATVQIDANATVSSGTVTNVAFFVNGNPVGSDQTSPFNASSGALSVGNYGLTAVATAAGISSTSAVVNITVLAPGAITLSSPKIVAGQFSFDYTATIGQNYVVENSSDFLNWIPLTTNSATTNLEHYSDSVIPGGSRSYRVGRIVP